MHPEILSLSLFMFVTSCSPGPNNVVASHSGFNHGIKKSIPLMLGVIFGFTTMLAIINFGLINIFNLYPIIQKILIGTGTIFLIYLSYKISFSKSSDKNENLKPVNFIETFFYQFLNPKITPSISGIDFFIPWLNPEWDATTLFGPGEQLVTNINKESDKISGCIITLLVNHS